MISVDEARARILERLVSTAPETVSLAQGWGRVLATAVTARLTQPPAAVSAMMATRCAAPTVRPARRCA